MYESLWQLRGLRVRELRHVTCNAFYGKKIDSDDLQNDECNIKVLLAGDFDACQVTPAQQLMTSEQ